MAGIKEAIKEFKTDYQNLSDEAKKDKDYLLAIMTKHLNRQPDSHTIGEKLLMIDIAIMS